MERNLGLDLLRAWAALWVVVIHGHELLRPTFPWLPSPVLFDPVDLFFTLSGFLIGRIILREIVDARPYSLWAALHRFWIRRWFRTVPAYLATIGLTLLFCRAYPDIQPGFNWRYLLFLQNLRTPHPLFMGNAWSLTIEEFFYVVFPLVVVTLLGFVSRPRLAYLCAALLLIALGLVERWRLATVYRSLDGVVLDSMCRKFLPARLDAIAYGALGSLVAVARPDWWRSLAVPGAVAAIAVSYVTGFMPSVPAFVWVAGPAVMPIVTLLSLPMLMRLPWLPTWLAVIVRHFSRISYSIYLVHHPLAFCYVFYVVRPHGGMNVVAWYAAYWAITMALAYCLHHVVELPGMRLRDALTESPPREA